MKQNHTLHGFRVILSLLFWSAYRHDNNDITVPTNYIGVGTYVIKCELVRYMNKSVVHNNMRDT